MVNLVFTRHPDPPFMQSTIARQDSYSAAIIERGACSYVSINLILTSLYSTILRAMATGACVQCCPRYLKRYFEVIGACFLKILGVLSVIFLPMWVVEVVSSNTCISYCC